MRRLIAGLVLGVLCLGLAGVAIYTSAVQRSHVTASEAADRMVVQRTPGEIAEAEKAVARSKANAICDKEDPVGNGTLDEEVAERVACLSRNGYRS